MKKITYLLSLLLLFVGVQCAWAQAYYEPKVSTDQTVYEYYVQNAGNNNSYYCTTTVGTNNCVSFSNSGDRLTVKFVSAGTEGQYNIIPTNVDGMAIIGVAGTENGSVVTYYASASEAQNSVFLLKAETGVNGYKHAFDIYPLGTTRSWNMYGGKDAGIIKLYNNGDQGGMWNLIPANLNALNAFYDDVKASITEEANKPVKIFDVIGGVSSASIDFTEINTAINTAIETANTALDERNFTEYSFEKACELSAVAVSTTDIETAVTNAVGSDNNHLYLPDGYYYFKSMNTDNRPPYLFNDYLREANTQHHTLQSATCGATNNYVWYVKNNGDGTIAIKNGEGTPVVHGAQNAQQNGNIITNSTLTFSPFNVTYFAQKGGMSFTESLNASNGGYKLSDNTYFLTTWADHPEAADNRWTFEPVSLNEKTVYTVSISGLTSNATEVPYVTCGTETALNGGFFIKDAAITAENVTALEVTNYTATVTVENNTISVVYEGKWNDMLAEAVNAARAALDAAPTETGIGYPTEAAKAALQGGNRNRCCNRTG